MALTITRGVTPIWFTPTDQEGEEEPVQFKIQPLTPEQLDLAMEGRTIANNGNMMLSASGIRSAIKFGLKGWKNINDENGELKYAPANVGFIPWDYRQELAAEIVSMSIVDEEDEKNS